jgi:hypothetical protein
MDVLSTAVTVDAYGGQSITRSTIYSARPCRINVLSFEQQALLSREGIGASHKFFSDSDMTISPGYELVSGGTTYPVVGVRNYDESNHHLTILTTRKE